MQSDLLDRLCAWLKTAPGFDRVGQLRVDYTTGRSGEGALRPGGVEVLSRRENLLGIVTQRCRCRFTLSLVLPLAPGAAGTSAANAAWLLELQQWVAQQSAAGTAPRFGNTDPEAETITAGTGRLARMRDEGTALYTMALQAEYTMQWEA